MTSRRKLAALGVPLLLGGLTVVFLYRLDPANRGAEKKPAAQPSAAQNPAHEIAALEESLKKSPGHVPILFRLAEIERSAGKPARAAAHLREIVSKEPNNVEARLELGRALYEAGDIDGALHETKQILVDDANNVDALYNLGAIHGNLNQNQLAREYWTRAAAAPSSESGKRAQDSLKQLGP
jgi:tetratricopeptide (TPR) repeat protein